jgi:3-methyladenine DNA glycosylase AlkD
MTWAANALAATITALAPHADPVRAKGAEAYMKHVAPFLGVATPTRRRELHLAWRSLSQPTSNDVGDAAVLLMTQREREFHYAAYDLISHYQSVLDADFLPTFGSRLLTTTPWWDSVDGLVTAMVSPLCFRFGHSKLIDEWSESDNRWLIRSAITHQRGWKDRTDFDRVFALCDRHWPNSEFFIAKAIGWALRDCARLVPELTTQFLAEHTVRNAVAEREIRRGLATVPQRRAVRRP